jgi:hypothetical protein
MLEMHAWIMGDRGQIERGRGNGEEKDRDREEGEKERGKERGRGRNLTGPLRYHDQSIKLFSDSTSPTLPSPTVVHHIFPNPLTLFK